jgi:TorA maturation chaperone TorD
MLHVVDRKDLYAMFCTLFSYPDRELAEQLTAGRLLDPAQRLPGAPAPPQFGGEPLLEALQVSFTGLFVNRLGGVPAPPYGSVYLGKEQQLHGPSTRAVAAAYQGEGLAIEQSCEPPDYLATELEFLYYLVGKEEEGLQRRELAAARSAVAKQHRFFEGFFGPWVEDFCRRIEATAQVHPLYRWAAAALARFCAAERDWLDRAVSLATGGNEAAFPPR